MGRLGSGASGSTPPIKNTSAPFLASCLPSSNGICNRCPPGSPKSIVCTNARWMSKVMWRSEEHTSELQSQSNLVCRLLLEKKKHPNSKSICAATCNQAHHHPPPD